MHSLLALSLACALLVGSVVAGSKDEHSSREQRYKRNTMKSLTREDRLAMRAARAEARDKPIRELCMREFHEAYNANDTRVFMQVLGLHASGTNYGFKMLLDNGFDVGMVPACVSNVGSACLEHTALWKHQDPNTIGTHPDLVYNASRYFFVIMIRNPFSWYVSLRHNPYDFSHCRSVEETTCRFYSGVPCGSTPYKKRNVWSEYSSWWGAWGEHYSRMLKSRHFRLLNATYVRYEDLALAPDAQLERIRHAAIKRGVRCTGNCARNGTWSVVMKPAKLHGSRADHMHAVQNILKETYRPFLPDEVVTAMCTDPTTRHVMQVFDYLDDCALFMPDSVTPTDEPFSSDDDDLD